tara:strand:+ start:336 stop:1424 length:1089 start_codon:yes stop_codon:yes gene_type:complete
MREGALTNEKPPSMIRNLMDKHAFDNCVPLYTTIELTLTCNLRCVHCYNFDRSKPYPKKVKDKELTPTEILSTIEQVGKAGCAFLTFTGGEAMLHPHLHDFVRKGREHGMFVSVKTNGTLMQPQRAHALAEAGVTSSDISIYGGTAETHDAFTLVKGSFERTLKSIEYLQEAGIVVRISCSVTQENAHEIDQVRAIADKYNAPITLDPQIMVRRDGTTDSTDLRVERDELLSLYKGPLRDLVRPPDFNNKTVQCSCARSVCGISCTGDVYPCIGAPIPSGNLREMSFEEIWTLSPQLNKIRNLQLSDFKTCETCADRPFCSRSSGVTYSNTGNYTGPEEFSCMQADVMRELYEESTPAAHDE